MDNPSSCRIWELGPLNHSFCPFEHDPTQLIPEIIIQNLTLQNQLRLSKFLTFIKFERLFDIKELYKIFYG